MGTFEDFSGNEAGWFQNGFYSPDSFWETWRMKYLRANTNSNNNNNNTYDKNNNNNNNNNGNMCLFTKLKYNF